MRQDLYEAEKRRLKDIRDRASERFQGWRDCAACRERRLSYCPEHRTALDEAQAAQAAVRSFIEGPRR